MKPGEANHYFSYQIPVRVSDLQGGYTTTWQSTRGVWGTLDPLSGNKRYEAMALVHGLSHLIRTWYWSGYSPDARFTWQGRTFKVKGVTNKDERNVELEWAVEEEKST
jgi:SPP1 family predicted phage head-tail adaptor